MLRSLQGMRSRIISATKEIKEDKKQLIGLSMIAIGACLLIFTPGQDIPDTLTDALPRSISTVLGTIFAFSGFCGLNHKNLKKRTLVWFDFLWMVGASLGVIIALTQALLVSSDDRRADIKNNIVSSRLRAHALVEDKLHFQCGREAGYDQDTCRHLALIYGQLREGSDPAEIWVKRICPHPVTSEHPLEDVCIPLNYLINAPKIAVMSDGDAIRKWKYWSAIIPLIVSFLLGMRVAKSVSELWWIDSEEEKDERKGKI